MTDGQLIAVTGASGFVGQALLAAISAQSNFRARGLYRAAPDQGSGSAEVLRIGDLSAGPLPPAVLDGVDAVVHLAARTHVLDDREADPLAAYRRINVDGTRHLAQAAAAAGVKRLIYLSSIKVNGESTAIDVPFTEASTPQPEDAYGQTKWEAEQLLWEFGRQTGTEIVVLRPPLIYGPGAKGNLRRLMGLVRRGVPLPLASVRNKRSMLGLDNLVGAIVAAVDHPKAAGRTFLLSDQHDLSTPDLLRELAAAMDRRASLVPFPPALLRLAGMLTRRGDEIKRLTGSLVVDSRAITRELGWQPVVPPSAGLRAMVEAAS